MPYVPSDTTIKLVAYAKRFNSKDLALKGCMMKNLSIKHIPLILFSIFVAKSMFTGATLADAAIMAVLGAVAGFYEYKSQEQSIQLLKDVQEKQAQTTLALAKELAELKSSISSVKLAQGMRTSNVGRI